METYFISRKKNNANENSSVRRCKQNRLLLPNCAASSKKKSRFIKNQEARRLGLH